MNHTTTAMVATNPTTITTASVTDAPYPALALATHRSASIGIVLGVALLGMLLFAACSGSPGRLTADRRVKIQEPKPGSTVTEPVLLRWSSTFEPGAASGL